MVEQDAVALARLELLSNTAMLKKVLDRKSERKGDKNEEKTFNIVQAPHQKTPSTLSIASHPLAHGEKNQRRESPSPRTILDSSRDAPPMFHERLGHAAFVPPHFSYNRGDVDSLRAPPSHTEGRAYQGNATFQRGFIQGAHGDMYYRDNCNIAAAGTSQMASRQHPSGGMAPYTVNENLHRPHYLGTTMYNGRALTDTRHEPVYHPPPRVATFEDHEDSRSSSYEVLARENHHLREQLTEKDRVLSSLQEKVNYLEKQIGELRQLPTGKISHIPIDDMIRIMEEYGSEVSNQTLPKRKDSIKKASIVRQFRRWNPEFFRYFIHANGEWVPKLGKEAELKRRAEKRRTAKRSRV